MIFQQVGALPQYANDVIEYLDKNLSGRWMGKSGPISWPARSPDLIPCDYYLWGFIKDSLDRDSLQTVNELKTKI